MPAFADDHAMLAQLDLRGIFNAAGFGQNRDLNIDIF